MTKFQVLEGVTNDSYHSQKDFISSTSLKNFTSSQLYFKTEMEKPKESKPHFDFGNILHTLVSSFHPKGIAFEEEYAIFTAPVNEKTGKPYGADTIKMQEAKAEALSNADGKLLCSDEDKRVAEIMVAKFFHDTEHPSFEFFNKCFLRGIPEVSYFAKDFIEGVNVRVRPDLDGGISASGRSFIIDYKFVEDVEKFPYIIDDYGYDISAAMYTEVKKKWMREVKGIDEPEVDFYWVVQEKKAPYDWIVVSAENFMPSGVDKFYQCLRMYDEVKKTGIYRGVSAYCPNKHGIFKPSPTSKAKALNPLIINNESYY